MFFEHNNKWRKQHKSIMQLRNVIVESNNVNFSRQVHFVYFTLRFTLIGHNICPYRHLFVHLFELIKPVDLYFRLEERQEGRFRLCFLLHRSGRRRFRLWGGLQGCRFWGIHLLLTENQQRKKTHYESWAHEADKVCVCGGGCHLWRRKGGGKSRIMQERLIETAASEKRKRPQTTEYKNAESEVKGN